MPEAGWNRKLLGLGNGGWAGNISVQALAGGLARGYAVTTTDTGHTTRDGSFALNHPEKLIDFGHRAVHDMTVQAKEILRAFYGMNEARAYWDGCSTGGNQGLSEAQRYPGDYNGIIAGAPANYFTHLMVSGMWVADATLKDPGSYIPKEKFAVLRTAALNACDAQDGVRDDTSDDPTQCHFDPRTVQCPAGDGPDCLTAAQTAAARKIYGGARNPRTGELLYPGLEPGSELGWSGMAGGPAPFSISSDYFKYVVFRNPEWSMKTIDFDRDTAAADTAGATALNATSPDLRAFFARGGKLLMYHGWSDMLIAPRNSVNYYTSVVNAAGTPPNVRDSIRLFMEPGVGHCTGGDGPSNFDRIPLIEAWVEQGKAPDRIVAARLTAGKVDRTRPLCPYPQVAIYLGTGDSNDAANFVCKAR
ncbi:MAG: tannase/feruloyl esterase family alpha/beta hydrolase [Casimicrobiaceae bacterium]